jgi:glutamate decarboxylase
MLSTVISDEELEKLLSELEEITEDENIGHLMAYYVRESPRYEIPDSPIDAEVVYHMINNELKLDGNPALNLASFVSTEMDEHANKLFMDNAGKNFVDQDEYPQSNEMQDRVVSILARLYNAPSEYNPVGTSAIGSSEAIMLGLLAHKWNWKKKRESEGKPTDNPNVIFGEDVHVVWKKFARYFDVEPRIIPMEIDNYVLDLEKVQENIDENTICVGAVVGTTFTGEMDPVKELNQILGEIKEEKGWDIPIHVDAASGGFVLPFVAPQIEWDFRLNQVRSINVSGHKYGLVYPGVGFLIFRDKSDLPDDLIFEVNYLGGVMPTYCLNFSKGASAIIAQYFNLLALGRDGYAAFMGLLLNNAEYLAKKMDESGKFKVINNDTRILPLVAFELDEKANFDVFNFSERIRQRGWIIPAYTLPKNAEEKAIMRIVIRMTMSREQINILFKDLVDAYDSIERDINDVLREIKHNENIEDAKKHHDTIC